MLHAGEAAGSSRRPAPVQPDRSAVDTVAAPQTASYTVASDAALAGSDKPKPSGEGRKASLDLAAAKGPTEALSKAARGESEAATDKQQRTQSPNAPGAVLRLPEGRLYCQAGHDTMFTASCHAEVAAALLFVVAGLSDLCSMLAAVGSD